MLYHPLQDLAVSVFWLVLVCKSVLPCVLSCGSVVGGLPHSKQFDHVVFLLLNSLPLVGLAVYRCS